ncbi:transglutaminase-like domain-containing protein [Pseudotabrizicola alkalilacus]|nr:transglutaminase-like domain-containing protein [Pseudotabrizicola alkalilacus]
MGYTVEMMLDDPRAEFIAPAGLDTPLSRALGLSVSGGQVRWWTEAQTGQSFARIAPEGGPLKLRFTFDGKPTAYPEAIFRPSSSRYTRAAASLLAEVADLGTGPSQIARAVAQKFDYGHPDKRFYDGHDDSLPALGCDRAAGSCVDINMYFLAALRAAGVEAGYIAGAFFPAEKGDWCRDGHCWIVTRTAEGVQEWDIAHHLKMGTRDIAPGLNPKPGFRAALSHSLGLTMPGGGMIKLLAEPVLAEAPHRYVPTRMIRLQHPDIPAGPLRPQLDSVMP